MDGETVTSPQGGNYSFKDAYLRPRPLQSRLPIMIGGGGEKKTLRTVARYADMWNWAGIPDLEKIKHKDSVLRRHCEEIGRDHTEIQRTLYVVPVIRDTEAESVRFFRMQMEANRHGESIYEQDDVQLTTEGQMIELLVSWKRLGFETIIIEIASPFDDETVERFATQIRPAVEAA